ncbi:MAG: hypothetical protein ABW352_09260, partial [Polyangiales bacterium]
MRGGAISITTILWLVLSTGVRAQELDYQAREGCPSRAEFERRLASRVRTVPSTALAITVRIAATATLTLRDGTTLIGERTLQAASCEEAVDALAFVAALLLEERARGEAPVRGEASVPPPPALKRPKRATQAPTVETQPPEPALAPSTAPE